MLTDDDVRMLISHASTLTLNTQPYFLFKDLRTFLKMTQEQMARKLGVSATTINKWEGGTTQPSGPHRHCMEKRLNLPPWFVYRMFPSRPPRRLPTAGAAA